MLVNRNADLLLSTRDNEERLALTDETFLRRLTSPKPVKRHIFYMRLDDPQARCPVL